MLRTLVDEGLDGNVLVFLPYLYDTVPGQRFRIEQWARALGTAGAKRMRQEKTVAARVRIVPCILRALPKGCQEKL